MQKHVKKELFLLSQLQHVINIDTRKKKKSIYNADIKPDIDYASAVWDGCGEVHLKNPELPTSKGGQINPS